MSKKENAKELGVVELSRQARLAAKKDIEERAKKGAAKAPDTAPKKKPAIEL